VPTKTSIDIKVR